MRKLFLFFIVSLLVFSCYPPRHFELDEPFRLEYGQTQSNSDAKLHIRFNKVVSDGRCPIEYECFTPGNAAVEVTLRHGFQRYTFVLNTYDDPKSHAAFGYTTTLVDLAPPNSADNPPSPEDYVVTLQIGKSRDTHCDDGTTPLCRPRTPMPECKDYEILAYQENCYACVNPATCVPWGEPGCKTDEDCPDVQACDMCGSSSCPMCDDCVPACRPLRI